MATGGDEKQGWKEQVDEYQVAESYHMPHGVIGQSTAVVRRQKTVKGKYS